FPFYVCLSFVLYAFSLLLSLCVWLFFFSSISALPLLEAQESQTSTREFVAARSVAARARPQGIAPLSRSKTGAPPFGHLIFLEARALRARILEVPTRTVAPWVFPA